MSYCTTVSQHLCKRLRKLNWTQLCVMNSYKMQFCWGRFSTIPLMALTTCIQRYWMVTVQLRIDIIWEISEPNIDKYMRCSQNNHIKENRENHLRHFSNTHKLEKILQILPMDLYIFIFVWTLEALPWTTLEITDIIKVNIIFLKICL